MKGNSYFIHIYIYIYYSHPESKFMQYFNFNCFLVLLELEPRALLTLGKYSLTELIPKHCVIESTYIVSALSLPLSLERDGSAERSLVALSED